MRQRVHIVGIGDDGLDGLPEHARRTVLDSDLLVGTERVLALASAARGERLAIGTDLNAVVREVEAAVGRRVAVLVGGDPLFFGIANLLCERLGKDVVEIVPHVSSMQLAFARVKEDWDDAYLGDAARHSLDQILDRVRQAERAGIFCCENCPPPTLALALHDAGLGDFRMHVCENLGTRHEIVTSGTPAEIARQTFGPLAVVVLARDPAAPLRQRAGAARRPFGNPDDHFRQSRPKRGLLTPMEVRTLALGALRLRPDSVVWDVGAGSGAVSVEAALLAPLGQVFAIEPDIEDGALIAANAAAFGAANVRVVADRAPSAFAGLPDPDAVFVGGLGRETQAALAASYGRLKPGGALAVNVASLENLAETHAALRQAGGDVGVLLCQFARGVQQLEAMRFAAANPSFLVHAVKPEGAAR